MRLRRTYAFRTDGQMRVIDYPTEDSPGVDISADYANAASGFARIEASISVYCDEDGNFVRHEEQNPTDNDSLASRRLLDVLVQRDRERGDFEPPL